MASLVTPQLIVSVVTILIVVHVVLITVAYLIYLERKISAYIQDRIGPNRVGPLGLLQPIADGLKFLLKEDYAPAGADKALFTLAPIAIIIPALIGWAVIPWGGYWVTPEMHLPFVGTLPATKVLVAAGNVNIGVIYLLAVASLGVYGVVLGGWASNSKYSFFGGLRASAGMISYEIPLGLALLAVLLMAGTVVPQRIVELQAQHGWFVIAQPLAALLFFVCILAEANRAPFDNAEAEQELVGGYHTEYSSMRFALFFLAEYGHMVTSAAFFTVVFLGGYHLPFVGLTDPAAMGFGAVIVKFLVLFTKVLLILCFEMVIRWTLPRIRWDQVMKLAWNSLIPLGIVLVVATAAMVYAGWTGTWQLLVMNLVVGGAIVAMIPVLPRGSVNERLPLRGSRFSPLPGERVVTGPTDPVARDDSGAPAAQGRPEREPVGA